MAKEITYQVKEKLGVLTTDETQAVKKELRLVSWNGSSPVYEIRGWKYTEDGEQALKGVTMTLNELKVLKAILNESEV